MGQPYAELIPVTHCGKTFHIQVPLGLTRAGTYCPICREVIVMQLGGTKEPGSAIMSNLITGTIQ